MPASKRVQSMTEHTGISHMEAESAPLLSPNSIRIPSGGLVIYPFGCRIDCVKDHSRMACSTYWQNRGGHQAVWT